MVRTYQVVLSASPARLSTQFAGDEGKNIPFRQLLLSTTGADCYLGDATLTTNNGVKISQTATQSTSLGPFDTGPLKLSDLYAVGAGATLTVLGVPF